MEELDTEAYYSVEGYDGIAFYVVRPETYSVYDPEYGDYVEEVDENHVVVVMVGDDREHIVPIDSLAQINEDDFCHSCGQIGCGH